jgi:hypothetical protein
MPNCCAICCSVWQSTVAIDICSINGATLAANLSLNSTLSGICCAQKAIKTNLFFEILT